MDEYQIVDVPGVGEVEFPASMSDADVLTAVKKLTAPKDEGHSVSGLIRNAVDEVKGAGNFVKNVFTDPGQIVQGAIDSRNADVERQTRYAGGTRPAGAPMPKQLGDLPGDTVEDAYKHPLGTIAALAPVAVPKVVAGAKAALPTLKAVASHPATGAVLGGAAGYARNGLPGLVEGAIEGSIPGAMGKVVGALRGAEAATEKGPFMGPAKLPTPTRKPAPVPDFAGPAPLPPVVRPAVAQPDFAGPLPLPAPPPAVVPESPFVGPARLPSRPKPRAVKEPPDFVGAAPLPTPTPKATAPIEDAGGARFSGPAPLPKPTPKVAEASPAPAPPATPADSLRQQLIDSLKAKMPKSKSKGAGGGMSANDVASIDDVLAQENIQKAIADELLKRRGSRHQTNYSNAKDAATMRDAK